MNYRQWEIDYNKPFHIICKCKSDLYYMYMFMIIFLSFNIKCCSISLSSMHSVQNSSVISTKWLVISIPCQLKYAQYIIHVIIAELWCWRVSLYIFKFSVACSQWPSMSIMTDDPIATALIKGYHSLHISTSPTINVHKNW